MKVKCNSISVVFTILSLKSGFPEIESEYNNFHDFLPSTFVYVPYGNYLEQQFIQNQQKIFATWHKVAKVMVHL